VPPTPTPAPGAATKFDKIEYEVSGGFVATGTESMVNLDGNSGAYSALERSGAENVAPKTGTLDATQLANIQGVFAKACVADLSGKPISRVIPDVPDFTITATVGNNTYTLRGVEPGIDPQYKDQVQPLIDALKAILAQAYPPVKVEAAPAPAPPTAAPPAAAPAAAARLAPAPTSVAQGRGSVSGRVAVDANGDVTVAGLKVLNNTLKPILSGASGKYVTVQGLVADGSIRVSSVLGDNYNSANGALPVLSSAKDGAPSIGTIPLAGSIQVRGETKDGWLKVSYVEDSGETRTGYVKPGALTVGGFAAPLPETGGVVKRLP